MWMRAPASVCRVVCKVPCRRFASVDQDLLNGKNVHLRIYSGLPDFGHWPWPDGTGGLQGDKWTGV